jgi:hypothetical protein
VRLARLLPPDELAASIYGTILVTSVLATLAEGELPAWALPIAVLVTALVFALAHAWALALERFAKTGEPLTRSIAAGVRHEWPIVEAAVPAALVLLFAALGLYSQSTGLWIAAGVNVMLLFAVGVGLRQHLGGTALQSLLAGIVSAGLGLVFVLLKILVH